MLKIFRPEQKILLPDKQLVRETFPHATPHNGKYLSIPHGIPETRILRRAGFNVPCPMVLYYQWRRKPWDAQITTAATAVMHKRVFILNDMGTGKTFAALAAIDYLLQTKQCRKALIVAPLSTLTVVWLDEILRFFPRLSAAVLHGTADKRRKLLKQSYNVFIINHDGVSVILPELQAERRIDIVVLDELDTYSNGRPGIDRKTKKPKHRLWGNTQKLLSGRSYVWGMTGTPCPNAPLDAWAQIRLIRPENVTPWWTEFRDETMVDVNKDSMFATDNRPLWRERPGAMGIVYNAMQPSVRFQLEDCQDIPETIFESRKVALSKTQQRVYDHIIEETRKMLRVVDKSGRRVLDLDPVKETAQRTKLLQTACGWVYDKDHNSASLGSTERLKELLRVLKTAQRKVVVFVPFKNAVDGVLAFLTKHNIECAKITSDVSASQRNQIFSAFQNSAKYKAIVAQPRTMSHGLNLTAANMIIWFAPPDSLRTYLQASRRITRPGQKYKQLILHLSGTLMEDRIYHRLRFKENLQGSLLELFSSTQTSGDNYGAKAQRP